MNRDASPLSVRWDRDQSGLVLAALAERPFKTVFETIGRINEQAHRGFAGSAEGDVEFRLDEVELELCLDALQDLPYRRVHGAISRILEVRGSGGGPA